MPSQAEIRDEVTARIIQALEADLLPWRRPWRATVGASQPGRHSNVASKKPYSGINPALLELHVLQHGFQSRWWGTFAQWHDLGCRIQKRPQGVEEGHWGCRVVLYKPITKPVLNAETGEEEDERFFILRTFALFCADQVDGAEGFRAKESHITRDAQPDFQPAEDLIAATKADIRHGGNIAYYHRLADFIMLPPRAMFNPSGAYYETAIHELSHWSEIRTGWDDHKEGYALSELAAEIASCYISAEIGIPMGESLENHAAYVKNWLEAMKGDRNYIFKAAKQASKVTDFLLSFSRQPEPVQSETEMMA